MTTLIKAGDRVLIYKRARFTRSLPEYYEATARKVTPTGQLTVDAGVWPGNGAPRIVRFKPSRWGGGYSEIGHNSIHDPAFSVAFGDEYDKVLAELRRDKALKSGANKVADFIKKLSGLEYADLDKQEAAAKQLMDAIIATKLVRSLPAPPDEDG